MITGSANQSPRYSKCGLWANVDMPTHNRKCFIYCRMCGGGERSFQHYFMEMERGFAYFSGKRSVKSRGSEFEERGDSM